MKNIHFIMLLIVVSAVVSCKHDVDRSQKAVTPTDSLADMKFLNARINFGVVSSDTVLKGKYIFINTSKHILIINSISPDCSCTSFSTSKSTIHPHDSAFIILEVSTKNKSGLLDLYATVSANTPAKLYSLKLAANVK